MRERRKKEGGVGVRNLVNHLAIHMIMEPSPTMSLHVINNHDEDMKKYSQYKQIRKGNRNVAQNKDIDQIFEEDFKCHMSLETS